MAVMGRERCAAAPRTFDPANAEESARIISPLLNLVPHFYWRIHLISVAYCDRFTIAEAECMSNLSWAPIFATERLCDMGTLHESRLSQESGSLYVGYAVTEIT